VTNAIKKQKGLADMLSFSITPKKSTIKSQEGNIKEKTL
jgi:hypothetical protein